MIKQLMVQSTTDSKMFSTNESLGFENLEDLVMRHLELPLKIAAEFDEVRLVKDDFVKVVKNMYAVLSISVIITEESTEYLLYAQNHPWGNPWSECIYASSSFSNIVDAVKKAQTDDFRTELCKVSADKSNEFCEYVAGMTQLQAYHEICKIKGE